MEWIFKHKWEWCDCRSVDKLLKAGTEPWIWYPAWHKTDLVVCICNSKTQEERLVDQEFKNNPESSSWMRPCFRKREGWGGTRNMGEGKEGGREGDRKKKSNEISRRECVSLQLQNSADFPKVFTLEIFPAILFPRCFWYPSRKVTCLPQACSSSCGSQLLLQPPASCLLLPLLHHQTRNPEIISPK